MAEMAQRVERPDGFPGHRGLFSPAAGGIRQRQRPARHVSSGQPISTPRLLLDQRRQQAGLKRSSAAASLSRLAEHDSADRLFGNTATGPDPE
jgi:hypothetical protein